MCQTEIFWPWYAIDSSALLGMPDTEMLSILRITCDTIGGLHGSRREIETPDK